MFKYVDNFKLISFFQGWIREEVPRSAGGISSRKSDVYYISPSGKKVRSKPELLKILGEHYDLSTFDYFTGKMNSGEPKKVQIFWEGHKNFKMPPTLNLTVRYVCVNLVTPSVIIFTACIFN